MKNKIFSFVCNENGYLDYSKLNQFLDDGWTIKSVTMTAASGNYDKVCWSTVVIEKDDSNER